MIPILISEKQPSARIYANALQDSINNNARALGRMACQWTSWMSLQDLSNTHVTSAFFADHVVDLMLITTHGHRPRGPYGRGSPMPGP